MIVVLSISGKKFKKLTDLFLQTLTHGTVHIVTCAKELQNIVLIVKANKVLHNFISMHVNHREIVTLEIDLPRCGTVSVDLLVHYTHLCEGEVTGQGAF